jgi:hypothetical protein
MISGMCIETVPVSITVVPLPLLLDVVAASIKYRVQFFIISTQISMAVNFF